jgi:hypothetical protein
MIERVITSETSVNIYQTTRRNIPEDTHLLPRANPKYVVGPARPQNPAPVCQTWMRGPLNQTVEILTSPVWKQFALKMKVCGRQHVMSSFYNTKITGFGLSVILQPEMFYDSDPANCSRPCNRVNRIVRPNEKIICSVPKYRLSLCKN